MIQFLLGEFRLRWSEIEEAARLYEFCAYSSGGVNSLKSPDDYVKLLQIVAAFRYICQSLELKETANQTDLFERVIKHESCTYQSVNPHLKNLIITANKEIRNLTCGFIPTEKAEYVERVGNGVLFGINVYNNFTLARADIKDAGNCLAADLSDAAVFHLLRVVETGLRELAKSLKVKFPKTPIDYEGWKAVVKAIDDNLSARIPKARGSKQSAALKFKHDLLVDFKAFEVLRNEIMHGRSHHNEQKAIGLFNRVRDFMQRLDKQIFPHGNTGSARELAKKNRRAQTIID